ncbi:hypothetical protein [Streptomyces sp. NBC_00467]|uniref:hypothetical protein n=1 Tax=Streptomyces sp. NBC_00467 TaxID=2975752 RepID=UPI002E191CA8
MSVLGTTARDHAVSCPGATFAGGLAVPGEEADRADGGIRARLQRVSLITSWTRQTPGRRPTATPELTTRTPHPSRIAAVLRPQREPAK